MTHQETEPFGAVYLDDQVTINPKRFTWTAKAEAILEKYYRAKKTLDKFQTA